MGTTALTEAVFYILLSLDAPLHGYGIMQNVENLSGGRVRLAAGISDHARWARGRARGAAAAARADAKRRRADKRMELRGESHV